MQSAKQEKALDEARWQECHGYLRRVKEALSGGASLPLDQFSCNTSYVSRKAWVAMLKQAGVALSVAQMQHLFDCLAQDGPQNKLHVSVIRERVAGIDDLDCTELEC